MNRLAVAVGVLGAATIGASGARADVAPEQVRQAIQRGADFLLSQQRADGSWPDMIGQPGGVTALCTLALLNAGVEPDRDPMRAALNCLRKIEPERTYVVALQTMVFARAEPDKDRLLIGRNVRWLEKTQIEDGPCKGAWTYPGLGAEGDNSNAQFALLALHEAERVGVAASDRTWRLAKTYWEKSQNADGSWGYNRQAPAGTGSMTCAGITSLAIAADRVLPSDARAQGDRIECCLPRNTSDDDRIERGFQWLGQHYSVRRNPGNSIWLLYYLYGLERTGRLTARRFIPLPPRPNQPDRADWYREGAECLIERQDNLSGFFPGGGRIENNPLIGTSFALLFLSKGRWPVLLGKLQYGDGDDWNRHRADLANLTRHVERRWRRDLTWQVVDLRLAGVDDLVQTPVLFLGGSQSPLSGNDAQRRETAQKLRDYLDRGGFLLAAADCDGAAFDRGFRELTALMFPEPEYKLRLLEPEHPVWYAEQRVDSRQLRPLWGVEFGCRTSVVYAPPDPVENPRPSLSCLWELSRPARGEKHSDAVQAQVDAALAIGVNVLAYATGRELQTKDDFFRAAAATRPADPIERGRLDVATLRHPGGCNAAPRAMANLLEAAQRELKIRARARPEPLDLADEALFDHHLLLMHGRNAFRLTDAERSRLRQFIQRGGMLLADSICASRPFSESFRREMTAVFPDLKLQRIAPADPLLGTTYGGFDLRVVSRRDPGPSSAPGAPLETNVRRGPPELEGIRLGDRWGVVFSPYDLSCALEKHASIQCQGYTREDAERIGLNVLLYSLQQ